MSNTLHQVSVITGWAAKFVHTLFLIGSIALLMATIPVTVVAQHYRYPEWIEQPDDMSGSHCRTFTAKVEARSRQLIPDIRLAPIRYRVLSGPGEIDSRTGVWEWSPSIEESGVTHTVAIAAIEGRHITTGRKACRFEVTVTNAVPEVSPPIANCGDTFTWIGTDGGGFWMQPSDADDCDTATMFVASVDPLFAGSGPSVYRESIRFDPATEDIGRIFRIVCGVSDGKDTSYCEVYLDVREVPLTPVPYALRIGKVHSVCQGLHEYIDVTIEAGNLDMFGFSLLIAYDASALAFQTVTEGDIYDECGWEYLTYRYHFDGDAGNQRPSGLIRISGMAELAGGPIHPTCYNLESKPFTLFTIDYLVTDDRTFECMYIPIRFYWETCYNNLVKFLHPDNHNPYGVTTGISRRVIDFDLIGDITDTSWGLPGYFGAPSDCLWGSTDIPIRFVDYFNGGIDIICTDSIDGPGDLNLDCLPNEIGDANLYANYFIYGLSVFYAYQAQVSASDVNEDGKTLTIEDFVYLIRKMTGDALPYPIPPEPGAAQMMVNDTAIYIETEDILGAAYFVLDGNIEPALGANQMAMRFAYDADRHMTNVLIYSFEEGVSFTTGTLLTSPQDIELVSSSFATYEGYPVEITIVADSLPKSSTESGLPGQFTVGQNYPNPFNNSTTIPFYVPQATTVELHVYNVLGEQVVQQSSHFTAGAHVITWEGMNQANLPAASGMYFYRLTVGDETVTRRMMLLK